MGCGWVGGWVGWVRDPRPYLGCFGFGAFRCPWGDVVPIAYLGSWVIGINSFHAPCRKSSCVACEPQGKVKKFPVGKEERDHQTRR